MRTKVKVFFINIFITSFIYSQNNCKLSKWSIEAGVGYNTMITSLTYSDNYGNKSKEYFVYDNLWFRPSFRLLYAFTFYQNTDKHIKVMMPIFVGYYTFGSKSKMTFYFPESFILYKINLFRSIENGINPSLETDNFQLGMMLKYQYVISAKYRVYYDNSHFEEWDERNKWKSWAMNVGFNVKWKFKHFTFGPEMWIGITNLSKNQSNILKTTENNYRFMFGYMF
jgi:hypothetical protein